MFKSGSQILPISLGCDVKSRSGMGIFLQMYSQITSMLYFNCAEIGITGAFSAIVPGEKIVLSNTVWDIYTALDSSTSSELFFLEVQ